MKRIGERKRKRGNDAIVSSKIKNYYKLEN